LVDRTHKEFSDDDIAEIAKTYHSWRSSPSPSGRGGGEGFIYEDIPGFCKSADLEEIKSHHYVLTPGRYVGAADIEDDGIPFEEKMNELSSTLYKQMKESAELDTIICDNLKQLRFGE
jgi:type I restriction enzyme M protein